MPVYLSSPKVCMGAYKHWPPEHAAIKACAVNMIEKEGDTDCQRG